MYASELAYKFHSFSTDALDIVVATTNQRHSQRRHNQHSFKIFIPATPAECRARARSFQFLLAINIAVASARTNRNT